MFYLYPKEKNPAKVILVKKNGKMTATITLTGTGYDYVYMGTPAQAKKAGKKKWIKYKKVKGFYTFKIPVSKLDKKLKITPHSSKYESDGDPSTDPWRPNKWIMIYSKGAKKVKDGTTIDTKGKPNSRPGSKGKKGKNSSASASSTTSSVNNSTSLKDGTYKPDRFSWSGGSGRLAYIRCTKITVKGGKAYATIEFSSSKYDMLKASGRTYHKSGGGNSKFTIPVKLNANNTIIGRTTAMSQPHWIRYTIFIYKKGAGAGKDTGKSADTKKLSSEAPELLGLEFKEEIEVKHAKYFRIYKYEQDIILIQIDQATDTALYKEEKKDDEEESASDDSEGVIEYDEDGNIIARSQNEITEELYENNVVNYLVVPEGVEVPAGLDKECIIIQQPADRSFVAAPAALVALSKLGLWDMIGAAGFEEEDIEDEKVLENIKDAKTILAGTAEKPDYSALVKTKANLALFPSEVLPEITDDDSSEEDAAESEEKAGKIGILRRRFSALAVPMLIDRSDQEKTNYGGAEWIKVYGAIYGKNEEAAEAFDEYTKDNKEKKQ